MSAKIMTRFRLISADPQAREVIATYQYGMATCNVTLPSVEHAQQLGGFLEAVIREAKAETKQAAAQYVRGDAMQMESESQNATLALSQALFRAGCIRT